jgi:uncharacterized RmlC-like cupin family protein
VGVEVELGAAARLEGEALVDHLHEHHETAIYVLEGRAEMRYGEGLPERVEVRAGQFLFIPAGRPHLSFNPSDRETCIAVLARADPNEQESVVLLDGNGRRPAGARRRGGPPVPPQAS